MESVNKCGTFELGPITAPFCEAVLTRLDFELSAELIEAADALVGGLDDPDTDPATLQAAWEEYARISEAAVEAAPDYQAAQIAALVHKASLFEKAGQRLRYAQELDDAEAYAFNAGLDVHETIADEISSVIETLPPSSERLVLQLKGIIDDDNRAYLRDQLVNGTDDQDFFGDVYGMIIEAGHDPDEILRQLGDIE